MKLQEIVELWDTDSKINPEMLANQASELAYVHNKYYKIYLGERSVYREMVAERRRLYKLKYEYYTGSIDQETLKEREWKPFALRVLKSDVSMYLEADEDLITLDRKIELQKDKIEYLESIIKLLNNRNFQIKNIIDYLKWSQGSL